MVISLNTAAGPWQTSLDTPSPRRAAEVGKGIDPSRPLGLGVG